MVPAFALVERYYRMEDGHLVSYDKTVAQAVNRTLLERLAYELFRETGDATHVWEVMDLPRRKARPERSGTPTAVRSVQAPSVGRRAGAEVRTANAAGLGSVTAGETAQYTRICKP